MSKPTITERILSALAKGNTVNKSSDSGHAESDFINDRPDLETEIEPLIEFSDGSHLMGYDLENAELLTDIKGIAHGFIIQGTTYTISHVTKITL